MTLPLEIPVNNGLLQIVIRTLQTPLAPGFPFVFTNPIDVIASFWTECPFSTLLISNYTSGARERHRQARFHQTSKVQFPFAAARSYNYPDAIGSVVYTSRDAVLRLLLFEFSLCKFGLILPCLIRSLALVKCSI
jgi:hypothetical protein